MKKICFISGCLDNPGGTERVGITIANNLSITNDVHIVSLSKKSNPYFKVNSNINIKYFNFLQTNNKKNYINTIFEIGKYLRDNNIEIVIEIDIILRIYTYPLQFFNKKLKIISWEHFCYDENLGIKLRDYSRKIAVKKSNVIITLTQKDLETYQEKERLKSKIYHISNPLNEKIDKINNLKNKKIICVGRLTYQKGFDLLLEECRCFFKKFPEWILEIYGEGEDKELLKKIIKKFELENYVLLKKPVKDINKKFLDSSIFLLPSRFEPFGMVLIEAMNCGVVPIAFENIGPNEIIKNEYNGILIEKNNVKKMFFHVERLIINKEILNRLSINAKKSIDKYNVDEIIKKWRVIIDEL